MKFNQDFRFEKLNTPIVAILVFIISTGMFLFLRNDGTGQGFFILFGIAISFYSYRNINTLNWEQISKGILIGFASLMFLLLVYHTIRAATSNEQWDFMCFYMQGLLGVHKLDFYDPNSFNILFHKIDFPYTYDNEFKVEIIDVGFLSPPITMLIYAPLALLNYHTSKTIFSLLIFVFIIANAVTANIVFVKKERSIYSFLLFFIIIILLPGTNLTIEYCQTNFFILFFLLLVLQNINKPISGLYLALSLIIKPITGILILFFIFNKNWKSVLYFGATGIVLLLITGTIWGFHNITGFFLSPPTNRLPQYLYEQDINQSLISFFNRNLKIYGLSQNIVNISYYLVAGILVWVTYSASKKLYKANVYLSFFPYLLCMLMIYPSSLSHYMVLLSPLLIYFLTLKIDTKYFWILLLPALSFARTGVFFTYFILWSILIYIGISNLMTIRTEDIELNEEDLSKIINNGNQLENV